MRNATLIRGARQLLTLRGPSGPRRGADLRNLGIIQDGAVLIANGLIREVGPSRRLENLALARGADEIDASGRVVMPGFVDCHAHLAGDPELSPRTIEMLALRVLEQAVRHGTTAVEAKSGLGLTEAGELKILRAYTALRELPFTLVPTFVAATAGQDFERLLPVLRRRKLAEFAEIRCEEGGFRPEQICRFLTLAREAGLGLKVSAGYPSVPNTIAMAVETRAVTVDGVEELTEHEAMLLSRSTTIATQLPGALFQRGIARSDAARMLIDNGAAVALATGYHPCDCPSQNMQMTIALACRTLQMTAAEAIAASTINAAHAMRREASIGSIESGKSADLLMLSAPDYRELPYHFGVNLVDFVMCRGAVLVERSKVQWPGR
ncbi:MAG TPA: amidohydrolase family protein [Bryobacteraceae bacterium]|nr:amidohydrolase family protein [Bryobacteraceae bacterium]